MKKIKIVILVVLLCGAALLLSGGVSLSREKIVPKALWNAVNSTESTVDSDKDGLSDDQEKEKGTDPQKADTDGDKFLDGQEVKNGYDPLRSAPGDKVLSNSNSNVGSSGAGSGRRPEPGNSRTEGSSQRLEPTNTGLEPTNRENLTEKVALKVDDFIARYKLYTSPYDSLREDARSELDKEINDFTLQLLKNTGLDFAFNIAEDSLAVQDNEPPGKQAYINRVKTLLRQNNLLSDNQSIEDGIRAILSDLTAMSKQDIDWEKTNNLKKEVGEVYRELLVMPINPEQKTSHIRLLRVLRSLEIVLENIDSSDYFKAFLAAGRAEKINGELDKFTAEIR